MWQLIQPHSCLALRHRLIALPSKVKYIECFKTNASLTIKRNVYTRRAVSSTEKCPGLISLLSAWRVGAGVGVGACLTARAALCRHLAHCKATRVVQRRSTLHDAEAQFDWKKLFEYLWPHRWLLAAAIASALAVALLNVYIPQMLGVIVNVLASLKRNPHTDFLEEIKSPALKLVSLYVGQAFFTFMYIHLLAEVGEKVASQLKQDLFVSILRQDMSFFDEERTGELVNRLTLDVQDFKSSFKQTISSGLRAMTQVVGSAVSLMVISPQLTGLTMLCVPSVVVGGTFIGSLLRNLSREAQAQAEKATLVAEEAISNMRTVRAFAGELEEARMFAAECDKVAQLNTELGLGVGLFQAGTNLFLNGMVLGTMFVGGHLMSSGQLSAGDVMAFLVNAQSVQRSVAQLSLLFGSVVKGLSAGSRLFEYINKEPAMDQSGIVKIKYHELHGNIEFKNVTFAYPTRPEAIVLKDFNLKIPAGKTIAIVGTSGNGKSTIAALLERFYDVNSGEVTIDGRDVRQLDASWLRGRALGFISQEPVLFASTVRENIRYGRTDATDHEVYNAAKIANAHEFITEFPQGYDTMVGERGLALSGGQKQRIAIARAVLKNPPIMILDEATSALDAVSEQTVQRALEEASRGRTTLVIAHRLSTVMAANLIVVLNKGRIVEMGTHEQLKKKKGFYWNLIKQQDQEDQPQL